MKNLLLLLAFISSAATAQPAPMRMATPKEQARIAKSSHVTNFLDDKTALKAIKNTSGKYTDISKVNLTNKTTTGFFTSSSR